MKAVLVIWAVAIVTAVTALGFIDKQISVIPQTISTVDVRAFCNGVVTPKPSSCIGLPEGTEILTSGSLDLLLPATGFNSVTDALQTSAGVNVYQGQ